MADMKNLDDTLVMDRTEEAPSSSSGDAAPKRVAHYDIKREIGRSALSVVYEAQDTHTDQEVALKLLTLSSALTPLEAEALVARFEREARTAARLSHPNIVHIHEVGADQGRHFLAMEYLKGQTLRARVREGMLTPNEAFSILAQITGALDAVHKAGVVHRDVKPTNVILLPNGTAKLLDFGIARSGKETAITRRGMIIGSPSYMAPEQIKGEAGAKATDIWALGVLSYEMLTGQLPFTGQNVGGVMFQIMHEAPAPMPALPPAVQQVLLRALDKRPSQRYPTAGALVQALKLAYPKQAPTASEREFAETPLFAAAPKRAAFPKAAAFPKPAVLPKPTVSPKPAASFSLPGPKWLPEAALLSLFLLGFCGAFLLRIHSSSQAEKQAASIPAAQIRSQSIQASAPPRVLAAPQLSAPQPQAARPDVSSAPAPVALKVQAASQSHTSTPAKQIAVRVKPEHVAPAAAFAPVQPKPQPTNARSANERLAANRQAPVPAASRPHSAVPIRHPAVIQVASRHFSEPVAAPQPVPRAERPELEQAAPQPALVQIAAPPASVQRTDQAVTLPTGGDGYDPEADARRRKSDWSQDGPASRP